MRAQVETKYAPRGYFWYRWMAMAQQHIFGTEMVNRTNMVRWPQDATFAVGGAVLRRQPRWLYESMLRVVTVEEACKGGTIMWAHSLERLWFELLDTKLPKAIATDGIEHMTARQLANTGACFLGARRV